MGQRGDGESMELREIAAGQPGTDLWYLRDMGCQQGRARVLKVVPEKRTHAYLILDRTLFHPKGGGQPSDKGIIRSDDYELTVKKAIFYEGVVIHWGKIVRGTPTEGEAACELDWDYRCLVMRRHTAAHLLDHCLAQATGIKVQTTDSWLDEPCYVGYAGNAPSADALRQTEGLANEMINKGGVVRIEALTPEQAKVGLQDAPNYERLPDLSEVRTVTIEGCQSIPCGGTHVANISEIEHLSVAKAEQLPTNSFRLHFSVTANASSP
jgi:alanyl-tRNA synthetase